LVTGFDIIFFWVARMMMMGIHFMGKEPFSEVYIHALVRDEKGQKMSKSKGNIVDPLSLIEKYGSDSLRFTLTAMAAQGRDVKLSESRVEGYRNFGTKIWNASRFCEINKINEITKFDPQIVISPINKWIIREFISMRESLDLSLQEYRFNDAANYIYHFTWGTFCDWYLELIKPHLNNKNDENINEIRSTCSYILDSILITLHPFMPFITEEIWQNTKKRKNPIIIESWERELNSNSNLSEADEIITLINIVSNIRSIKAELNIKGKQSLFLEIKEGDKILSIKNLDFYLNNLVKVSINKVNKLSEKAAVFNIDNSELALIIPDNIDLTSELDRVIKEEEKIKKEISNLSKRLENKAFINKAPKEVVEENVKKLDELKLENESIKSSKELVKNLISK